MCGDVAVTAACQRNSPDAGSSRLVFWPELDALASCVKDQLGVDADPRFAGPERRPLANELQRLSWRQRPGPPPRELIVRGATAAARSQDRFCRLGVTLWSCAHDGAAIGELQTDLEGPVSQGLGKVDDRPACPVGGDLSYCSLSVWAVALVGGCQFRGMVTWARRWLPVRITVSDVAWGCRGGRR
jgi:hypothetical protein